MRACVGTHAAGSRVTPQAVSKIEKSISKRVIFGRTKKTGARRCLPRDIQRMPIVSFISGPGRGFITFAQ